MLTQHAQARLQQRGIAPMLIDLLFSFGVSEKAAGGVEKLYFDKTARRRIKTYAGPLAGTLDQYLDIYAVVKDGHRVITIGHRTTRIKSQ